MKNLLPTWLYLAITKDFPEEYVYELRIRKNKPLQVNFKGRLFELVINDGMKNEIYYSTEDLISYIISVATKQSLYAYIDQIKNGYISTDNGVRIGLCGTAVYENDNLMMINKISSLNIRFGHKIQGVSNEIIKYLIDETGIKNTLIISPPGAGKTTMLRDIIQKLSDEYNTENILVADERFELAGFSQEIYIGKNVDVISGSNKYFAFNHSLKVMNPTIIATDEISEIYDMQSIAYAIKSGVSVIATAHANGIDDIKNKKSFSELMSSGYFERFIVLSKRNGVGTIEGVFDEKRHPVFLPYN